MGYPTDPVGRMRLHDNNFPPNTQPDIQTIFGALDRLPSPNSSTDEQIRSGLYSLPSDDTLIDPTYSYLHSSEVGSQALEPVLEEINLSSEVQATDGQSELGSLCRNGRINTSTQVDALNVASPWSPSHASSSSQTWASPASTFDQFCEFPTASMELNGAAYFSMNTGSDNSQFPASGNINEDSLSNFDGSNCNWNGVDAAEYDPSRLSFTSMDLDHDPIPATHEIVDRFQPKSPDLISISSTAGARTKLRSLFRPRSSGSSHRKKKYTTSQYTRNTEDSGYASGYASCLTLDDVTRVDPQSLSEFNGLYRVACQHLHEPRGMANCRDIPSCRYCRYSSIHNLGWSARYLKFEVFLSELRLTEVYEFGALDAAGNTALHYAAAGGANFLYLKALIDVGVDPYAANTAGELFIHCLRPLQPFTLEPNSDCLKGDDLIRLLELLQPARVLGVRDNNGQTILHALALKVADSELKAKIFT